VVVNRAGCCLRGFPATQPHSGLHGQSGARSSFVASKVVALALGLALAACRAPLPMAERRASAPAASLRAPAGPGGTSEQLTLTAALPIRAPEHFQPSALALDRGRLLTVSDHEDGAIYWLELGETAAQARPYVTFSVPEEAAGEVAPAGSRVSGPLDFEALVRIGEGRFWILSEGRYRVLEVVAAGDLPGPGRARWLTASFELVGRAAGLFQVPGGDVEGLARSANGGLLIAAERQPRGLLELPPSLVLGAARVWALPDAAYQLPRQRPPDFADLAVVEGAVFALVRNAHLVVRLTRAPDGWREGRSWSYAAVENDPRWVYADAKFGLGEGLAISEQEVFVVLDNNELPRAAAPADRRAQLFRFPRPPALLAPD